ncbi:glycosyltransferase [Micromonospora sp. NPDC007271]|uniref:glycosyltransferase n=1 Tax=Micromonospora sp. NPDC007271 TaxID=3154587 RepID=UPI0033C86EA7
MIPRQRDGRDPVPYVLAVVGTDVHRFDRLVDWLERWHAGRPGVRVVLQYGHSRTPRLPEATPFLGHEELQRAMAEATLVVSHGGPATITEARRTGHLPIVVPRDPAHDEHVDNHQQLFARRLGAVGLVRLCESAAELVAALDEGLADPSRFTLAADPDRPDPRAEAVARVGQVIDDLVARRVRQRVGGQRR